jgi:hypothetical protein
MRIDEILGFARTSGKKFTVKKRPPEKFDEPVALKIKNRRADAAKGKEDAWKNKVSK